MVLWRDITMTKFARMIQIMLHLQANRKMKACELAKILDTNVKTIYRDIESLRTAQIPIKSEPGRYGGYYIPENFYFKIPKLTYQEIAVLFFAGEILIKDNGFMFEKYFKSALSKIKNCITVEDIDLSKDKLSSISYEINTLKTKLWENIFYIIENSIVKQHTIKVEYYTLSRDTVSKRLLDPYHLMYKNGAWYLIAYCHWRKSIKIFRVDRIKAIKQTEKTFIPQEDFSPAEYLKNSWQVIRGEKFEVKVRFFEPAARFIKEIKWLPTQKIVEERDGSIVFSAQVSGLIEIKKWILGYGSCAQVLEPKVLQDEIIFELNKARELYD